jgi:acyl carrier protein
MNQAQERQLLQVIADVLNLPVDRLKPELSPKDAQGWDSVQHLNLVLAIEQAMGVQFEPEDIERMQSVGEIVEIVREKLRV